MYWVNIYNLFNQILKLIDIFFIKFNCAKGNILKHNQFFRFIKNF